MRTITIKNTEGKEKEIQIRPLTRREIRDLKEFGYSYVGCIRPTLENAADLYDKAFEKVLSKKELAFLDECTVSTMMTVWMALFQETYGDPEESKNSGNTTAGTSTEKE